MTSTEEKEIRAFLALNRLRIEGRRRVFSLFSEGRSAQEVVERMESEDLFRDYPVPEGAVPFSAEKEIEFCAQKGSIFCSTPTKIIRPSLKRSRIRRFFSIKKQL